MSSRNNSPSATSVETNAGLSAVANKLRPYSSRILMAGALAHLLSYPILSTNRICDLITILSVAVMVLGGSLLARSRSVIWFILTLGLLSALAAGARFVDPADLAPATETAGRVFNLLLSTTLAGLTIRYLVAIGDITPDQYAGAVTGYLLIALAFADTFLFIEYLHPGSFTLPAGEALSFGSASYTSLVTLTTLGYGDVVPLSPMARIAAALESVLGVLYLALLVSRLVSQFTTDKK